jgi:hypothetical protein
VSELERGCLSEVLVEVLRRVAGNGGVMPQGTSCLDVVLHHRLARQAPFDVFS